MGAQWPGPGKEKSNFGNLSYAPAHLASDCFDYSWNESYEIDVYLPEEEFARISNLFISGKLPSTITVRTPDVEYGVAPDGSDIFWDITSNPVTVISGISIDFSTEAPRVMVGIKKTDEEQEIQEEEENKLKLAIIESRQDIQLLRYSLSDVKSVLDGLSKQLSTIITLMIAIGCVYIISHSKF